MKKLLKICFLLTIVVTVSCSDDEYTPPYGDYSSKLLWTSGEWDATEKSVVIDTYVSFQDLSQGLLSHEWRIPEGNNFLNSSFTEDDTDYTNFIIPNSGLSTKESLAHVLFRKSGIQEVKLHNVYMDSVPNSSRIGNSWLYEETFTVDVFAHPTPKFKIYNNDTEVFSVSESDNPNFDDKDSWPTLDVEAGGTLSLVDLTTEGRPSSRDWITVGGKPEISSDSVADIKYNRLGEYYLSMASKRNNPKDSIHKWAGVKINVIPSSQPFEFGGEMNMDPNGKISFSVTGEVESMLNQEDNFTVHVVNTDAGFDQNIPVSTATVNSSDGTIIELTLTEPVFNTDEITVSFSGGTITSVDERVLDDFGPIPVVIDLGASVLIDSWASYENSSNNYRSAFAAGFWTWRGFNGSELAPYWSRTTEKAYSGSSSMRYQAVNGITERTILQGSDFSRPNGIPAGKYRISFMVYLEEGNTMSTMRTYVIKPWQNRAWDLSTLPRGEWVEISRIDDIGSDIASGDRFDIEFPIGDNPDALTGSQTIYLDNLKFVPLIPRP